MKNFWGKNRIVNSVKAVEGAQHLLEKIHDGALVMEVLPNNYGRFTGDLEENNYISFCQFLKSSNGKKVLTMLEEADAGRTVEL